MYTIEFVDEKTKNYKLSTLDEVHQFTEGIGPDGAVLIWVDQSKSTGIINYYNQIYAYITFKEEIPERSKTETHDDVLRTTLQQHDRDDLVVIMEEYDKFIQEDWLSGKNGPMDLLTYVTIIYKA